MKTSLPEKTDGYALLIADGAKQRFAPSAFSHPSLAVLLKQKMAILYSKFQKITNRQ
jgi:hypothetical protein